MCVKLKGIELTSNRDANGSALNYITLSPRHPLPAEHLLDCKDKTCNLLAKHVIAENIALVNKTPNAFFRSTKSYVRIFVHVKQAIDLFAHFPLHILFSAMCLHHGYLNRCGSTSRLVATPWQWTLSQLSRSRHTAEPRVTGIWACMC